MRAAVQVRSRRTGLWRLTMVRLDRQGGIRLSLGTHGFAPGLWPSKSTSISARHNSARSSMTQRRQCRARRRTKSRFCPCRLALVPAGLDLQTAWSGVEGGAVGNRYRRRPRRSPLRRAERDELSRDRKSSLATALILEPPRSSVLRARRILKHRRMPLCMTSRRASSVSGRLLGAVSRTVRC
jgi:hypothetical protein